MLRIASPAVALAAVIASTSTAAEFPIPPKSGVGHPAIASAVDQIVTAHMVDRRIPGMTVAVSHDGRLIYAKGFGYRNWDEQEIMEPRTRGLIGSNTKIPVTMGMMHLLASRPGIGLKTKVYGPNGIIRGESYQEAIRQGVRRHRPIVGLAIGGDNHVLAWFSDGMVSEGRSDDLDAFAAPVPFTLPPNQTPDTITAIARGGSENHVYTWYDDGTVSVGTPTNLGEVILPRKYTATQDRTNILGIAMAPDAEITYTYYQDGTVTSGSVANLASRWTKTFVSAGSPFRRYDIVDVARSANDVMVAWYSDGQVSKGNATDLGAIAPLSPFERRAVPNSIQDWIGEYNAIEVRHLLSHTSGFTRSGDWRQAQTRYQQTVDEHSDPLPYELSNKYVLSTRKRLFAPGERAEYSNHGMGLTGFLIEKITGSDWHEYVKANILDPIGLNEVIPQGTEIDPFGLDSNAHKRGSGGQIETQEPIERFHHSGSAAGSYVSSAVDLVRLMVATDKLPNHSDVLTPAIIDLMESRPFPSGAPKQAFGWHVECSGDCTAKRLYHNGGHPDGGSSQMEKYIGWTLGGVDVDGLTVAVVANIDEGPDDHGTQVGGLVRKIAKAVGERAVDDGFDLFNNTIP